MKKLSTEAWAAVMSAAFAAVAVIFSGLTWNAAHLADDNMIEHEIFSRQLTHCFDQFDAASSYFGAYVTYQRMTQESQSSLKSGDTDRELIMIEASNRSADSLAQWYAEFNDALLRDTMLMPDDLAKSEDELSKVIAEMHATYLFSDFDRMANEVENPKLPAAMKLYRDQCRAYLASKRLVVPKGD